jgi:hypothetical protein
MSLELKLELECGITVEELMKLLREVGAEIRPELGQLGLQFVESGMACYISESGAHRRVAADGMEDVDWEVCWRLTLRYSSNKFEEVMRDVKKTLYKLRDNTDGSFVLSFQFENIVAIRDENGLRLFDPLS